MKLSRRKFLSSVTVAAVGALAFAACDDPSTGDLKLESVNGEAILNFSEAPALRNPGGSVRFSIDGLNDRLIAVRASVSEIAVLSALCTHRQCDVNFVKTSSTLDCPCHGSEFDLSGQVLVGPATIPLALYAVSFDPADDFATITTSPS